MTTKYKSLSDWLMNYPAIGSWLYFNVTNPDIDDVTLNSVPGERTITTFIDGTKECELIFAIDMIKMYDIGTADTNIEALNECEAMAQWCENQSLNGNLPTIENGVVNFIEVIDDTPSLMVDAGQNKVKYQFQAKMNYLEYAK